ncbi:unnamed protein product [Calypogeia fissa]
MAVFRRLLEWHEWRTEALLLVLFLMVAAPTDGGDINTDTSALLLFKTAVDPNNNLFNWRSGGTACSWTGISCTNNRVWKVRLYNRGLVGRIPDGTLGALDQLRAINMHTNNFSGSLPQDIADLSLVQNIYFHNNSLSGPLPSNFTLWPRMLTLDLANNRFNGSISSSLGELKLVKSIYLDGNQLSGSIPDIPSSTLVNFDVASNNLSGSIPTSVERFGLASFAGNPGLCGPPTNVTCPPPPPPPPPAPVPSNGTSAPPPAVHKKKNGLSTGAIIAIVLGDVALLLILAVCCIFCYRRHKGRQTSSASKTAVGASGKSEDSKDEYSSSTAQEGGEGSKLIFLDGKNYSTFDLEDLLRASAEVLGKGSVGTAYKAVLEDGTIVTVKRLKDVTTAKKDFESQIEVFGRFKHRNLVPLRAYFFSKAEKLLVYDYMPAGSLSALLHGTKGASRTPLDWISRVRIAIGAARGLAFLHNEHSFPHGNIKSSNILLTRELEGCVSDFGLAQLLNASAAASRIIGYKAPEVLQTRKVTFKADVYSFGVLLLELVTGKAPTQVTLNDEGIDLPRWVQSVVREEWTAEVFDEELLRFQNIEEEMVQMLQIAMQCVLHVPEQRPTMDQVVKMLEDIRQFSDSGNENGNDTSRSAYDTSAEKSKDELDVPSAAENPSDEFSISDP